MSVDLSIVIVTFNSARYIDACLSSIQEHTRDVSHEVIVIDNASSDATVEALRRYGHVRLFVRQTNAGLSSAINEAVALSRGVYIASLNPDVEVRPGVLSTLVEYLKCHADVGVVAPRLINPDGTLQLSCRAFPGYATALFNRHSTLTRLLPNSRHARRYLMTDFDHQSIRDVDWVSGAMLLLPRRVFNAVGGWDAGYFMYNEDVDLCRRVHDARYRVVYNPTVSVVHHIGGSTRSLPSRMVLERHRSMWRYYRKHLRGGRGRDALTAGGIAARCTYLLAANNLRRFFGAQRA